MPRPPSPGDPGAADPPAVADPPPVTPDARLEALVRDYGRLIRHVVRKVGGRDVSPVADDVEQAVLMSLWQQLAREQTIEHPSSYVYRAAVRETVRAVRRERERCQRQAPDGVEVERIVASSDPHREVEARQQQAALAACLGALAPDRARAVRAHLAGFSVDEVMALFGWPYQRARNLIARGMADLRLALRARGVP